MANDTYTGEGAYTLNRLKLFSMSSITGQEEEIELFEAMVEMSLFESIFDMCMSGYIAIVDSVGMNDILPLYGNERVELSFHTAGAKDFPIEFTGYVYKISERHRITEHSMGYKLMFTSLPTMLSLRSVVQSGYKKEVDLIVQDIFRNHLSEGPTGRTEKRLTTTPTNGIKHYTFGEVKPLKAIQLLTKQAVSKQMDVGYFFFETNQEFRFQPLQEMYRQQPIARITNKPSGAYIDFNDRFNEQIQTMQAVEFIEDNSLMSRIMDGFHGSTHSYFDLNTLSLESFDYSRSSQFNEQKSLGTVADRKNIEMGDDIHFMNYRHSNMTPSGRDTSPFVEMLSKMKKREIDMFRAKVTMFGDSVVQVGDTRDITFPSLNQDQSGVTSPYNGKVLVTEIRHTITKYNYMQTMKLQKDAFEEIQ